MFPARFTLSETEDGTRVVRVGRDLMSDRSTSKFTIRLAPDPKTLIRDPMQAKTFAEDKRYVGMFD